MTRTHWPILILLLLALGLPFFVTPATAQEPPRPPLSASAVSPQPDAPTAPSVIAGNTLTYQGYLAQSGSPANGTFALTFRLYDGQFGGTQVGSTVTLAAVPVTNGLFTVSLDFGVNVWNGEARWLELQVASTTLTPRQPVTAAPLASALPGLYTQPNNTSANVIGGYYGNSVTLGAVGATIGGGGSSVEPNRVTDLYGTVAGGRNNQAGDGAGTVFDGGLATVGGGVANTASGSASTIAGGINNTASGSESTVAGGAYNIASGFDSVVGGGTSNSATNIYSVVAGGAFNSASGGGSVVGGGDNNTAPGTYGIVSGGANNTASGYLSVVAGGIQNIAAADYSFAAGSQAVITTTHSGSFVYADSSFVPFNSVTFNEFAARATGGVRFVTAINTTTGAPTAGVRVPAGGSGWLSISDRAAKANFASVDTRAVLNALVGIPLQSWNYSTQDARIRHIGPMAQDFYAAFGVGEDERMINSIDADGVALAAIQGVHEITQEQADAISSLQSENALLAARLAALESGAPLPTWPWLMAVGGLAFFLGSRYRK